MEKEYKEIAFLIKRFKVSQEGRKENCYLCFLLETIDFAQSSTGCQAAQSAIPDLIKYS